MFCAKSCFAVLLSIDMDCCNCYFIYFLRVYSGTSILGNLVDVAPCSPAKRMAQLVIFLFFLIFCIDFGRGCAFKGFLQEKNVLVFLRTFLFVCSIDSSPFSSLLMLFLTFFVLNPLRGKITRIPSHNSFSGILCSFSLSLRLYLLPIS